MKKIPKVFHTFWLSEDEILDEFKQNFETWKKHNPNFNLHIHRANEYEDLRKKISFLDTALTKKKWCYAADYLRSKVLDVEGGVYLDGDVICYKSLDELIKNREYVVGVESMTDKIECAVLMFAPGNIIMKKMVEWYENWTPDKGFVLMPYLLEDVMKENNLEFDEVLDREFVSGVKSYKWNKDDVTNTKDLVRIHTHTDKSYTMHNFTHTGYGPLGFSNH